MIKQFKGEHRWLSNFWPVQIEFEGRVFHNLENAYHSAKSSDEVYKNFCAQESNPRIVKEYGYGRIELRKDWEEVKFRIMEGLVREKFTQEPLRSQLIETGDEIIEEGNTWGDTCWGVDIETGEGTNRLGKIIMKIREELKNE